MSLNNNPYIFNPADTRYIGPDGRAINVSTTMGILMSDDFGGANTGVSAGAATNVDPNQWTVYDGGYPGIGSGITGMTDQITNSSLLVNLGTVTNAERWYLSNQVFAGSEDVTVLMAKSVSQATNMMFVGLVEVDSSGNPIANPNNAAYTTNYGGLDLCYSGNGNGAALIALADSSPNAQTVYGQISGTNLGTVQEFTLEYHAEDIIASCALVDNVAGKQSTALRVSTQVPNDKKTYKLLLRFKNVGTPGAAMTGTIARILVVDGQENRVEVTSGRGDSNAQKAVAVNVTGGALTGGPTTGTTLGASTYNTTAVSLFRYASAAGTNAQVVNASQRNLYGGHAINRSTTTDAFLKIYNKTTAPNVGTDIPVFTICLPFNATEPVNLDALFTIYGYRLTSGVAMAITGAYADADATAVAANQVYMELTYA